MNFKKKAAEHQYNYFNEQFPGSLSDLTIKRGREQKHWLNDQAAAKGLMFFNGLVFEKVQKDRGKDGVCEWLKDTLRSQHIPYNLFIPLTRELGSKVFSKVLGKQITLTSEFKIEYPNEKENPLKDKTSFDAFVEYLTEDSKKGFLGIEVKYTEGGYSAGKKELEHVHSVYGPLTKKMVDDDVYYNFNSELYTNEFRQIWRNHLLAYSYKDTSKYDEFISLTIFPKGNKHMGKALCEFTEKFLTDSGKKTLIGCTYEEFVEALELNSKTEKEKLHATYLKERYLISN